MSGLFGDSADVTLSTQAGKVSGVIPTTEAYRAARGRKIILIHGYNTSEEEGLEVMEPFRDLLRKTFGAGAPPVFTSTWAGKSPVRFIGYPFRIRYACASAKALLQEICRRYASGRPRDLVLVAHSLGCRLVLEFLTLLAGLPRLAGLRNLTVVLMAPAVPISMLEASGKLNPGLNAANRLRILHSHFDEALGWVFRAGQTAAGEGWFPRAVGLTGDPFSADMRDDLSPLGHNGYWTSQDAAVAVSRAIGVQVAAHALVKPTKTTPPLRFGPSGTAPILPMH